MNIGTAEHKLPSLGGDSSEDISIIASVLHEGFSSVTKEVQNNTTLGILAGTRRDPLGDGIDLEVTKTIAFQFFDAVANKSKQCVIREDDSKSGIHKTTYMRKSHGSNKHTCYLICNDKTTISCTTENVLLADLQYTNNSASHIPCMSLQLSRINKLGEVIDSSKRGDDATCVYKVIQFTVSHHHELLGRLGYVVRKYKNENANMPDVYQIGLQFEDLHKCELHKEQVAIMAGLFASTLLCWDLRGVHCNKLFPSPREKTKDELRDEERQFEDQQFADCLNDLE